jgi:hypothetical protein
MRPRYVPTRNHADAVGHDHPNVLQFAHLARTMQQVRHLPSASMIDGDLPIAASISALLQHSLGANAAAGANPPAAGKCRWCTLVR